MNKIALAAYLAPILLFAVGTLSLFERGSKPRRVLWASRIATWASLLLALLSGAAVFRFGTLTSPTLGYQDLGFSIRLDSLSTVMFVMVSFIGALVVQFSRNYLDGDARHGTFLGALCAVIASVFLLVLAGNLIQLVVAWIATSLTLHRLLLFYPDRPGAQVAAKKKFIVARIGDVALIAGAALLIHAFGVADLGKLFLAARETSSSSLPWSVGLATLCLAIAAILKSAMFPTHGWLLEVMETPTPVSALLHAGLLNGGTFLVVRFSEVMVLFSPSLHLLMVVGAFTALFASIAMLTQTSVKVSLAYSSSAHMGFMLVLCGFGAYSVAIMHLVAHSCYKAHAFLSSGSMVEYVRSLGAPQKRKTIGWTHLSLGLLGGLIITVGLGGILSGEQVLKQPGTLALGLIFTLALLPLFIRAVDEKPQGYVLGLTAALAVSVGLAFLGLELSGAWILSSVIPKPVYPDPITLVLIGVVVVAFAFVSLLQVFLPNFARSSAWKRMYVHFKNGLYTNALFDRWIDALRSPKLSPSSPIQLKSLIHPSDSKTSSSPIEPIPLSTLEGIAKQATFKIAPLWPLKHFVAVNPFLGLVDHNFEESGRILAQVSGARVTAPRTFYAQAIKSGRIQTSDLQAAIEKAFPKDQKLWSIEKLKAFAHASSEAPRFEILPTVSDVCSTLTGQDWTRFVTQSISSWAASFFDEGQAPWESPFKDLPPYQAWRAEALQDRTPEWMGVQNFRKIIEQLPESAPEALQLALQQLGMTTPGLKTYLHRLLMTISGWAGYARYRVWDHNLYGREDSTLSDLLTIRVAWDLALLEAFQNVGVAQSWAKSRPSFTNLEQNSPAQETLTGELLLQQAFERALHREMLSPIGPSTQSIAIERPQVQAAFCIDVRSEVFRRALERIDPAIETIGFAGFFGFPIEYVPLGATHGGSQCPVLLTPQFVIPESVEGASEEEFQSVAQKRTLRRRITKAWRAFKFGAVSCFGFVGPVGLVFSRKLITDSLGKTRPVKPASTYGLDKQISARLKPGVHPGKLAGRATGLTLEQKIAVATGVLKAMSMTEKFARLVVLVGHGSTTVNNPHATGLDCGACGGHTGEANARVAASILNDPEVRQGLAGQGIHIPSDTVFIAAQHDTTTDEVSFFDLGEILASHREELGELKIKLERAGSITRAERAKLLNLEPGEPIDAAVLSRSRDWSQVRPEWGLAGCAAFIVAPRSRTQGVNLKGRSFLHSYNWHQDQDFSVLELIMTAPMVVASWINLQYYGSTVDNRVFGSGNKTLHNVVGVLGVLEGNGGDLKVGLPWQSVHDGERFIHEPARLAVVIEAPIEAMNTIIAKHESVRQLLDYEWLYLFAMNEKGKISQRYTKNLRWEPVDSSGIKKVPLEIPQRERPEFVRKAEPALV